MVDPTSTPRRFTTPRHAHPSPHTRARVASRDLRAPAIAAAAAILVGLLLAAWLLPPARRVAGAEPPARLAATAALAPAPANGARGDLEDGEAKPARPEAPRPVTITHIEVEKPVICQGESTFVNVSATGGRGGDLRYQTMYARNGFPRYDFGRWTRFTGADRPGKRKLMVFVEDGTNGPDARDEQEVEITVDDCALPANEIHPYELAIRHREIDSLVHEFSVSEAADRVRRLGKTLQVQRWDFGDGAELESGLPTARHAYDPVLEHRYNYYLVKAHVDIDGEPFELRYGFTFYSLAGANLKAGYVVMAVTSHAAPETDAEASFLTRFTNLVPFDAVITGLQKDCLGKEGLPIRRERQAVTWEVPGSGKLLQRLTVDKTACPAGVRYELFGKTKDRRYDVGGVFAHRLNIELPKLTREETQERMRKFLESAAAEGDREDT
ncbi:MAG: hypothetical protein HYV63_19215 [Candidatus Schekmanbacteria bacterium]|nr:hypothetical protein [Candidatus Schekmanbacteria bacterium]